VLLYAGAILSSAAASCLLSWRRPVAHAANGTVANDASSSLRNNQHAVGTDSYRPTVLLRSHHDRCACFVLSGRGSLLRELPTRRHDL
jgi:hypothetical protein